MGAARNRLKDPVVWGNAFQVVKTVGAAVLAWGLAKAGLRPAATVPRALGGAADRARHRLPHVRARPAAGRRPRSWACCSPSAAGAVFGVNAASLGVMLLLAMAAGTTRALRDESTTAAATALVVLLTGYSGDLGMLGARLSDTVIGIAVGLLVNLLVWPPLRDRTAARQVDVIDDRLGALLSDIAARHARGARRAGGRDGGSSGPASSTRTSPTRGRSSGRRARAAG